MLRRATFLLTGLLLFAACDENVHYATAAPVEEVFITTPLAAIPNEGHR